MSDKETMPELLPCPFCGGDAICDIGMSPVGSKNYFVYCPEHMYHEAEVFSKDGMNKAIERWNTRHDIHEEQIEVLKRIITARDATIKQLEEKCNHIDEMLDDWVIKENEYIPTSKREKDLANYGWNKCVYTIRESFKRKGIKLK